MSRNLRSSTSADKSAHFGSRESPALENSMETVETTNDIKEDPDDTVEHEEKDSEEFVEGELEEAAKDSPQRSASHPKTFKQRYAKAPHFLAVIEKFQFKAMPTLQVVHRLLTSTISDPSVRNAVPQRSMANCSFVIHIPPTTNWKMLLSDGLGVWKASKGPTNLFVRKDTDGDLVVAAAISREQYTAEDDTYYFQRRTFVNQSCTDYHRVIVNSADHRCEFAYIQYYFKNAMEHEFDLTMPMNTRLANRTRYAGPASAIKRLKMMEKAEEESAVDGLSYEDRVPSSAAHSEIESPFKSSPTAIRLGSLPDSLEEVIAKCNQEVKSAETFILEVTVAPEPKIFLSNRRQLNDIRRFCTLPDNFGILCKDVLLNAGESGYCVTFTVYEHLMLRGKDGRHPCVLGPMYVHRSADFYTGYEFAVTLVKFELAAQNLTAFGPSSDTELDKAFQMIFPHARRYMPPAELHSLITNKLEELEIKEEDADTITQGISSVLSDEIPLAELDEHVYQLMDIWQSLHQNGTEFGQFFLNNIVVQIRQNLELKRRSGGSTPDVYALQVASQMKAFIKKTCAKKCSLPELIRKLREIVWKQEKELEGAVIGKADIKLESAYANLHCSEVDFFNSQKTPLAQRRIILNRIHEQELV